jgi:glycosyltransferase involved in cell wall biosynthesis
MNFQQSGDQGMLAGRSILYLVNDIDYFLLHRTPPMRAALDMGMRAVVAAGGRKMNEPFDNGRVEHVGLDIERHRLHLRRDIKAVRDIVALAQREEAHIVHAITIKPILYALIGFRIRQLFGPKHDLPKLILTFPGLGLVFEAKGHVAAARRWLVSRVIRACAKHLDCTATFENEADRTALVEAGLFRMEQTEVTFGAGIDTAAFHPPTAKRTGPLRFLCASRLIRSKGVEDFLAATRLRRSAGSTAEFILAGLPDTGNPDALPAEVLEQAQMDGIVTLAGPVSAADMPRLLRSVDVVCLPSKLREGFPRILIEGAASGSALLASRQPSVAQIIFDGTNGYMTQAGDVLELEQRMAAMERDPEATRRMGEASFDLSKRLPISEEGVNAVFLKLYGAADKRP